MGRRGRSRRPSAASAPPGLGDQLGDGALAYRRHLLGDQLHLAPIVGPLQDPDHAHPLAVHGPAAADVAGRHLDVDLGGPVPQGEEHPPAARHVGRYTSPSTATRPTPLRARAISPASRTSVTCRAAPRAGSSHSFMLI